MSPPTYERGPAANGTPPETTDRHHAAEIGHQNSAIPDVLGAELRARRATSWRCPRLASGYRDPVDGLAAWTPSDWSRWRAAGRAARAHLAAHGLPIVAAQHRPVATP